jgi:hypothetical protein
MLFRHVESMLSPSAWMQALESVAALIFPWPDAMHCEGHQVLQRSKATDANCLEAGLFSGPFPGSGEASDAALFPGPFARGLGTGDRGPGKAGGEGVRCGPSPLLISSWIDHLLHAGAAKNGSHLVTKLQVSRCRDSRNAPRERCIPSEAGRHVAPRAPWNRAAPATPLPTGIRRLGSTNARRSVARRRRR